LAVPWANYTEPGTIYGLSLNGWGLSTNIPSNQVASEVYKYFSDPFYINTMGNEFGLTEGTVAGIFMILVFIFTIITLLISIKAFRGIGRGDNKSYLMAGIFSIVTLVLCVIAVLQANSYGSTLYYGLSGSTVAGGFGYTWAFILTIIAMIFFFINYAIPKFLLQSSMLTQQTQPYQQQPQMMYTSQQQPPIQQMPPQMDQPNQQTPPPQQPVQPTPPSHQTPQTQQVQQPQPIMNSCPKCGTQSQADSKFCPSCGAKI
jgi:hypothetical protein